MAMQFHVRTFHASSGSVADRVIEGESADAVQQAIEGEGATVLSIALRRQRRFARREASFDVVLFCDEVRTLLSSGMSLVEAIDTLCSKGSGGTRQPVLLDIRKHLLEGKSLSVALEMNRHPFPPLLIASIRASERTSRLDDALDEYASYEKTGRELGKKVISAAIYPGLVVSFGLLVSLFMLSCVVPRFASVYADFSGSLSMSTLLLMKLGQFLGNHLLALLLALAAAIAAGIQAYRNGSLKTVALRMLRRSGGAQYYLHLYQLARIYQTMSMLLKGGYTLTDAIPLAQSLAFDAGLKSRLANAHRAIAEGKRLSTAFADNKLSDNVTVRLLQAGERSGNLARVLDIVAQTNRQEFSLFIERATRLAEPLLLMAVALLIGAIIVLMYMPVFDLAGGI